MNDTLIPVRRNDDEICIFLRFIRFKQGVFWTYWEESEDQPVLIASSASGPYVFRLCRGRDAVGRRLVILARRDYQLDSAAGPGPELLFDLQDNWGAALAPTIILDLSENAVAGSELHFIELIELEAGSGLAQDSQGARRPRKSAKRN
jgi:hypothetical protein